MVSQLGKKPKQHWQRSTLIKWLWHQHVCLYNFVGITRSRKDTGRSTSKWTDRAMNSWLIDLLKDDHLIIAFKFSLKGFDSFIYISSKRWIISNKALKKYKSRTTSPTINNNWWCCGVIKTNQRLWHDYVFGLCPHPFLPYNKVH